MSGATSTGTSSDTPLDCLIIGAGPGGLTAATYLARFHRRSLVVDAGSSRARWIPTSHNCPGFPFGVAGPKLLEKLRAQAEGYGVEIVTGRVARLERDADGFLATAEDGSAWRARFVILATGVVDRMPPMPGLEDAIARNVVRLCAVCDGYEASDERIAVYAPADDAIRHALFLRTFSRSVTAVRFDDGDPSVDCAAQAREARIAVLPAAKALRHDGACCVFTLADGSEHRFDTVYPVLGSDAQSQLATALGAAVDDNDELIVDDALQTGVDGLYAIGDVVSALNQISVAVGHAAIAASAVHQRLPRNFREDETSQPETAADLPAPTRES
ncbi:MAG: NAD(P)/FAD-dependent oxidoreductase [Luteimonas sp.]|nr:NAD(P)/FAD-dependent oxidoreductase [Luteimonas sp.]